MKWVSFFTIAILLLTTGCSNPTPIKVSLSESWVGLSYSVISGLDIEWKKTPIMLSSVDGRVQAPLKLGAISYGASPVSWAPDGNKLAYTAYRDGLIMVVVQDGDGNIDQQVEGSLPSWSPDGKQLAFMKYEDSPAFEGGFSLGVYDFDTRQAKTIYSSSENSPSFQRIAWSSDGEQIYYDSFENGRWGLYVIDVNGQNFQYLFEGSSPDFSSTDSLLVYENGGKFIIYDPAEKKVKQTINQVLDEMSWPSWSQDGKELAFSAKIGDHHQIFIIQNDGSGVAQVTNEIINGSYGAFWPEWRPK